MYYVQPFVKRLFYKIKKEYQKYEKGELTCYRGGVISPV
jgi:hypothetical protein